VGALLNVDFTLDVPPDRPLARDGESRIRLDLDDAALARKLAAARGDAALESEVTSALSRFGPRAFATRPSACRERPSPLHRGQAAVGLGCGESACGRLALIARHLRAPAPIEGSVIGLHPFGTPPPRVVHIGDEFAHMYRMANANQR
jgi:hypothetical protein